VNSEKEPAVKLVLFLCKSLVDLIYYKKGHNMGMHYLGIDNAIDGLQLLFFPFKL